VTFKQAIVIAAIFEFAGALLVGGNVTNTVRKGIIDPTFFTDPDVFILGMLCSLCAAAVWLNVATYKAWPVSTTHSIIGAVVGFGLVSVGAEAVNWGQLGLIVMSWVVSPLCGALLSAGLFILIRRTIMNAKDPIAGLRRVSPCLVGLIGVILTMSMVFKGLKNLHLDLGMGEALALGLIVGAVSSVLTWAIVGSVVKRRATDTRHEQYETIEGVFIVLQILTAAYIAFSHGANDVANAIGPLAAVVSVAEHGLEAGGQVGVPLWILLLGGCAIVVGLVTYGYKVMRTIGEKITAITPSRGFCATFGAATTILIGSKLGLPLSTTHTLVGSVIGVGMVQGMAALDMRVLREIAQSWVITVPFTGVLAAVLYLVTSQFVL
jgi:PiT family inorganic phosphate transporter